MDNYYRSITQVQPANADDLIGMEFGGMHRTRLYEEPRFSKSSITRFAKQNREIISKLRLIEIMVVLAILSNLITASVVEKRTIKEMQPEIHDQVSAARFQVEQETIRRIKDEYGITDEKLRQDQMDADAGWNAIMLQAYADAGNSDAALYLVGCSAKNRQLSGKYPGDMHSVVSARDQYMGFDESRVPTARVTAIAKNIEKIYTTIGAPMSTNFVYINWTSREVKLLDNLEKGVPTHTFYESDMEDFLKENGY